MADRETVSCPNCGARYKNRFNMVRHLRRAHQGESWDCRLCGQRYLRKDDCRRHIKEHHPSEKKPSREYMIFRTRRSVTPEELTNPAAAKVHLRQYPQLEGDETEEDCIVTEAFVPREIHVESNNIATTMTEALAEKNPGEVRLEVNGEGPTDANNDQIAPTGAESNNVTTTTTEVPTEKDPEVPQLEVNGEGPTDANEDQIAPTEGIEMIKSNVSMARGFPICIEQTTATLGRQVIINRRIYAHNLDDLPSKLPWEIFYY